MSGSSLGSIGRIAFMAVGYYFGGPTGAAVGGMLGGLVFPEKLPGVSGPRLNDQQFTTSTEGTAIPLVYGAHVVNGNFIWASPLDEVENTESQGGKGGPSQEVTTYTYFLSFAVGLCEGPITGVPRIWENGKLIYDRRAQQDGESASDYAKRLAASDELDEQMTIYLGDEDQLADPVIESHEGVGEVPAYRGLAYIVFERRDVTEFGGRPAQYIFEVTRADLVYTPTSEITTDALPAWVEGSADPRAAGYSYDYRYGSTTYDTEAEAVAAAEADLGYELAKLPIWRRRRNGEAPGEPSPLAAVDPGEDEFLNFQYIDAESFSHLNTALMFTEAEFLAAVAETSPPGDDYDPFTGLYNLGIPMNTYFYVNIGGGIIGYLNSEGDARPDPAPTTGQRGWAAGNNCIVAGFNCPYDPSSGITQLLMRGMTDIGVRRLVAPPPLPGSDLPDWPVDPDDYWWDSETGEIYSKAPWVQVAGSYRWLAQYAVSGGGLSVVQRPPLSPVLEVGDPNDTEAFWTSAYDAADSAGTLPSGMTYDSTGSASSLERFPRNVAYAYTRTYTAVSYADYAGTTIGSIVRDQCERSGLMNEEHFDVSNLDQTITGYKIERVMNGRDIIAPLRSYALFDGLDTDKLRFPLRGRDVVATLGEDDLGAHEPGNSPPYMVDPKSVEEIELPYAIRVRYADTESEYQPGQQLATRKVTAGVDALDVETTIAMDATDAAQMADVMLQEAVTRGKSYEGLMIGPHHLALTSTDAILVPERGELQRVMITEDSRAMPGIIEAKAVRDDQSIYTSYADGTPGGAGEQTLTPIGDTDLVIIDGPALTSASDDAGVFLAACGASDRWRGYGLFESIDGGANFSRIGAYTLPTTMGTLIDAIPEGPFEIWDEANSFTVAMDHGTLESRTEEAITQGANAVFVGAAGRWEVLQFTTAVAEGVDGEGRVIYRLSGLLRGRQGTEWAIGLSQVGDRLALCSTCQRLSMEVSRVGTPRLLKAVSFGRTSESGPEQTFTPEGVALKPYAPWDVEGQRDGSDNLDIYATRRTRIAAEWNDADYVPLNEDVEAYEVDIVAEGSPDTVLRTLTGSSFPIEYTAAQQTTDFGSPQGSVRVRIYQISASVGRGYPTEAIL